MELISESTDIMYKEEQPRSTGKPFIEANTVEGSLDEIRNHLIPVYFDNQPVISHHDFIDITSQAVSPHPQHIACTGKEVSMQRYGL